jgi:replicative DNA helicase
MSENQIRAIGPTPSVADLFVGALLYSTAAEVLEAARFVDLEDIDEPGQAVYASVVALARRGVPPSSQLVLDDLRRMGKLTRSRGVWLASAATSGACSPAARQYAAAVVAESLRRQAESSGTALIASASAASEVEVAALAEIAFARVRNIAARLVELRGDDAE